ncbi:hypothetical protein BARVI_10800 [Barnesiella viscericola DSM 18177]|uniref:Uncharacterized protein n=1 Tax=Barnesiella viscericola DSM 18177 TaxID=880074 RepID=W0ESY1_9BACT|nr:hypothetical protein BARVI_10800 [Barnesiella viscericola DSM 18177]
MFYSIKKLPKNLEGMVERVYLCIAFRKNNGSTEGKTKGTVH